eukprot:gene14366-biopygen12163
MRRVLRESVSGGRGQQSGWFQLRCEFGNRAPPLSRTGRSGDAAPLATRGPPYCRSFLFGACWRQETFGPGGLLPSRPSPPHHGGLPSFFAAFFFFFAFFPFADDDEEEEEEEQEEEEEEDDRASIDCSPSD